MNRTHFPLALAFVALLALPCFAQSEGYLQVIGGRALILVEEAHDKDDLDASELRERLQQAESELENAGEDSERRRVAERDVRRWEAFLEIAEGG